MSIKKLIDGAVPQAVDAITGAAKDKANEAADKLKSLTGGWGSASKLLASGKDKLKSARDFITGRKKEADKGLSPAEVDAAIEKASKAGEATVLDKFQAELGDLRVTEEAVTAAQIKQLLGTGVEDDLVGHKVKLIEKSTSGYRGDAVIFDVMPEVVENRTVEYEAIAPPQYPSAFQKYKGTSSTQWTVQATLTCRNTDEATKNLRIINLLRGWTMPFFGHKIKNYYPNKLGAPPPVLEFSGWRNQMVGPVQVVITSLNWNFPQDVDYIPARGFTRDKSQPGGLKATDELIPFPTVIKVSIQLVESFSTDQINGFDLNAFRAGNFDKAFAQTLSVEATTGVNSTATRLVRGGAQAGEEAQTVAGGPTDFAANNAALGDFNDTASEPEFVGPPEDTFVGPPFVPSGTQTQAEITKAQRQSIADQINDIQPQVNLYQNEHDRIMKDAARNFTAGNTAIAEELEVEASGYRTLINEGNERIASLGQQYDALSPDVEGTAGTGGGS